MAGESGKVPALQQAERLGWIDGLRGVGILAVVIAHVWTRGFVRDAIYSFHMPLFFLLSGYTGHVMPMAVLLKRLLRALALPFLCFTLLLLAVDFGVEALRHGTPIFPSWCRALYVIVFATQAARGPFTILWFVPCLFFARLFWNALAETGERADAPRTLIFMALVLILATFLNVILPPSPLGLVSVPTALLFIWLGELWRLRAEPPQRLAPVPVIVALAVAAILWLPAINMKRGDVGWPLLSLAGATLVTIALGLLVRALPLRVLRALGWVGRRAMVIMYAHVAFVHYLAPYWPRPILFCAALGGSLLVDALARSNRVTRRLLLGQLPVTNPA